MILRCVHRDCGIICRFNGAECQRCLDTGVYRYFDPYSTASWEEECSCRDIAITDSATAYEQQFDEGRR